jgi:two-component system response regulator FlrC
MRLLVVGRLSGQLAAAVKMAMAHGAKVQHVERTDQATEQLRRGQGADLLMVDYNLDISRADRRQRRRADLRPGRGLRRRQ